MAHATISAPVGTQPGSRRIKSTAAILAWGGIVALALGFVFKYVLFYYRHYDAASFDTYWPRRFWLFLHINGGTLALLMGPFQFWTGLRRRNLEIHRWTGRLFLVGVAMGIAGAIGMAIMAVGTWAFEVRLMGLASAWLVTTAMAYYCDPQSASVPLHKEWMIRAYVVTFAFVHVPRHCSDYAPTSQAAARKMSATSPSPGRAGVAPLAVTEMIFQLKRVSQSRCRVRAAGNESARGPRPGIDNSNEIQEVHGHAQQCRFHSPLV